MPDQIHRDGPSHFSDEPPADSISMAHVSHTLKRYRQAIRLILAIIMLAYAIGAVIAYLASPTQRIASLAFRLDFEGAGRGQYPNGVKFSSADITATPVLLRVYDANNLKQFIKFEKFAHSLFVLESNREYERIAVEYQAKLADPRVSPVDRERLERDYQSKLASISRSGYTLNYLSQEDSSVLPVATQNKVLSDVLATWARQAAVEKRVLDYQKPALTMNILQRLPRRTDEGAVAMVVLRSKINDILVNMAQLTNIPGISLVRAPSTHSTMQEVGLELQDITRFRIEPLITRARLAGTSNRTATLEILESQLAYDQRSLSAAQQRESALKGAFTIYMAEHPAQEATSQTATATERRQPSSGETVMPQLSESFIDRIVTMANQTSDREYRQHLVDEIKLAALAVVPLHTAVSYDTQLLIDFRSTQTGRTPSPAEVQQIQAERDQVYNEVAKVISEINEIYTVASRQLNPVTELFTITSPVFRRTERSLSISRLTLYGLLVFLVSIPVVITGCFVHNRIREEESAEAAAASTQATH